MPIKFILTSILFLSSLHVPAQTWDEWFRQKKTQKKYLLEQIAKLKVYLEFVKKGYQIAQTGLTTISEIKSGDFTLHSLFFDRLKAVNPKIKKYWKVAAMIDMQVKVMGIYRKYVADVNNTKILDSDEIGSLYRLFTTLVDQFADNMEALLLVVTATGLEMADKERLQRIDLLFDEVSEKYSTVLSFTNDTSLQIIQRERELNDLQTLKNLYQP